MYGTLATSSIGRRSSALRALHVHHTLDRLLTIRNAVKAIMADSRQERQVQLVCMIERREHHTAIEPIFV